MSLFFVIAFLIKKKKKCSVKKNILIYASGLDTSKNTDQPGRICWEAGFPACWD